VTRSYEVTAKLGKDKNLCKFGIKIAFKCLTSLCACDNILTFAVKQ
jgi:hypothetical protein